jgi:HemY protein
MKGLIWVIGLSALAVLAALVLQDFHGNVVILVPPYRADMGLAAFALALLLLFIVLLGLIRLLSSLLALPELAAQYRARRAQDQARDALALAVVELAAGRFSRALSAARAALKVPTLSAAAQLLAAQAAHELSNPTERDALLAANLQDARSKEAALLTQAKVALDDRDPTKAREALSQLSSGPARRVQSLRLRLEAARGASEHDEVSRIVALLHKHGDMSLTAANALAEHAATAKLNAARYDLDKLRLAWRNIELAQGRSSSLLDASMPRLVITAAKHFAALGAVPQARDLLSAALNTATPEACDDLLANLAELTAAHNQPQIDAALLAKLERWCAQYPRSAAAALAAGTACAQLELWGKARVFLKDSVRLDAQHTPTGTVLGSLGKQACLQLARMEDHLGESDKALSWYRQATQGASNSTAAQA